MISLFVSFSVLTVSYIIGAVAAAVTLCVYLIFLNKKSDLKLKTKA